jgi:hypothetical protein
MARRPVMQIVATFGAVVGHVSQRDAITVLAREQPDNWMPPCYTGRRDASGALRVKTASRQETWPTARLSVRLPQAYGIGGVRLRGYNGASEVYFTASHHSTRAAPESTDLWR